MTDRVNGKRHTPPAGAHPLWVVRWTEDLSREKVARLLDPPVSTKTLERWEKRTNPVPVWRVRQLAHIYRVKASDLEEKAA